MLGLRTGCCPDPVPEPDGPLGRHLIRVQADDTDEEADGELAEPHLIRSRHYKNATDEDGNDLSAGVERDVPWVAIAPVVRAIRVLERIVPDGHLLFDTNDHRFLSIRPETGSLKTAGMRVRIEDFVAWANAEALAHGLPDEVIPPDPHGAIGTARFRRSLAWHIARRPGGLVALALQYGHMRTALGIEVSEGYASRSRGGIHRILDVETALAVAETAAELREHFQAGGGISGPAARLALLQAANTPRFEGREVKPDFARKLLARDGAVLHDNPHAFLLCLYKPRPGPLRQGGAQGLTHPGPVRPRLRQHRPHRPPRRPASRPRRRPRQEGHPHPPAGRRPIACQRGPTALLRRRPRPHPHHPAEEPSVSPAIDERERIRAAMDRILSGAPHNSDGALTIVALAHEAGVPRNALTQRHPDLRNEFYEHVRRRGAIPDAEARLRKTIAELKTTIANKNEELDRLRGDVPQLIRVINQLTLENQQLREAPTQPGPNAIPLRTHRPIHPNQ